jgi:hypothetical protein
MVHANYLVVRNLETAEGWVLLVAMPSIELFWSFLRDEATVDTEFSYVNVVTLWDLSFVFMHCIYCISIVAKTGRDFVTCVELFL